MSRNPVSVGGRPDTAEIRDELLSRLGLRASASDQDVEAAHNGLVEFLELAPHEVNSWAAARAVDVDEAFALLSGPEQDLVPAASLAAVAQDGLNETSPAPSSEPARSSGVTAPATRSTPSAPAGLAALRTNKPLQKKFVGVLAPLLVLGVVLGVYFNGKSSEVPGISGTPTNSATTASGGATSVPLDQVKVAALMEKITANPKDTASLAALGDLYFASSDFKNAGVFEQKILAIDPKNLKGLLAFGAAQFNQGNAVEAKKQWLVAAGLYPKSAEVHYDLGFLYMSQTPPDQVNMKAEWAKVVEIDPNSAIAKSVATHINGTKTPAPSASATPSAK
jgi:cytochrome c-type biogenesis protein CcmH/NrfG